MSPLCQVSLSLHILECEFRRPFVRSASTVQNIANSKFLTVYLKSLFVQSCFLFSKAILVFEAASDFSLKAAPDYYKII